jgi:hypothetical protein
METNLAFSLVRTQKSCPLILEIYLQLQPPENRPQRRPPGHPVLPRSQYFQLHFRMATTTTVFSFACPSVHISMRDVWRRTDISHHFPEVY